MQQVIRVHRQISNIPLAEECAVVVLIPPDNHGAPCCVDIVLLADKCIKQLGLNLETYAKCYSSHIKQIHINVKIQRSASSLNSPGRAP